MPVDALIQLQPLVTKTATFSSSALILPGGTPRRGMVCRVIYSAASNASGANAVTFNIDVCYDGGPTVWNSDFFAPTAINLSTTVQSGEVYIPFSISPQMVAGVITAPQIRLTAAFSGAGTSPTITYQGDLSLVRP